MFEDMLKDKGLYSILVLVLVSGFLAVLLSFLFLSYTNLSSEITQLLAVSIAVSIGIFIDESIFGERTLLKRLAYSLFIGVGSGLGVFIFNYVFN